MAQRKPGFAFLVLLLFVGADTVPASPPRRPDNEQDLLARLQRESDPIKKAKLEIRLGRVKLLQSIAALDQGNLEETNRLLGVYRETLSGAWDRLKKSGRVAHKKPAGFKELDIELREDARYLEDLRHRIPYAERGTAEKVAAEVGEMRNEVLKVLFPPTPLHKGGDKAKQ